MPLFFEWVHTNISPAGPDVRSVNLQWLTMIREMTAPWDADPAAEPLKKFLLWAISPTNVAKAHHHVALDPALRDDYYYDEEGDELKLKMQPRRSDVIRDDGDASSEAESKRDAAPPPSRGAALDDTELDLSALDGNNFLTSIDDDGGRFPPIDPLDFPWTSSDDGELEDEDASPAEGTAPGAGDADDESVILGVADERSAARGDLPQDSVQPDSDLLPYLDRPFDFTGLREDGELSDDGADAGNALDESG